MIIGIKINNNHNAEIFEKFINRGIVFFLFIEFNFDNNYLFFTYKSKNIKKTLKKIMTDSKKHILGYFLLLAILIGILFYFQKIELTTTEKIEILFIAILIGAFYSILPDIDEPSSKLRNLSEKLSLAAILCFLLIYVFYIQDLKFVFLSIALVFFLYILWFSKHRGIFHSILIGILLSLPLYFINIYFFAFALFGFLTHLLIDWKFLK